MRAQCHWMIRHKFGQLSRTGAEGFSKVLKILQLITHGWGDPNTMLVNMAEAFL